MRAFIAIELPGSVRAALVSLQRQLAQAEADVKWVEEDNLHVTMRFLGEIGEDQRQAIERLLGEVAGRTSLLQLSLSHLGAFPSPSSPRVIWVGVGQGSDALSRIAREIEEGLSTLHLPREPREFAAHLTLGRVRSPRNRAQLSHRLKELVWKPPAPFEVAHLTFFQSSLTSSGPSYTALAKLAFREL